MGRPDFGSDGFSPISAVVSPAPRTGQDIGNARTKSFNGGPWAPGRAAESLNFVDPQTKSYQSMPRIIDSFTFLNYYISSELVPNYYGDSSEKLKMILSASRRDGTMRASVGRWLVLRARGGQQRCIIFFDFCTQRYLQHPKFLLKLCSKFRSKSMSWSFRASMGVPSRPRAHH